MSYEKHNWVNGETITDTLLNHLEDGVANASSGGVLIATYTITGVVDDKPQLACDKTFQELNSFVKNGGIVVARFLSGDDEFMLFYESNYENDHSIIYTLTAVNPGLNTVVMSRLFHGYDNEEEKEVIDFSTYTYPSNG